MTAPPQHFGAHDGAALLVSKLTQLFQTSVKARAKRVVSVIVEAGVLPPGVDVRIDLVLSSTAPAQIVHGAVGNACIQQRTRQIVLIELRIGARATDAAHVDQMLDSSTFKQSDEDIKAVGGMPDGGKGP